MAQATWLTVQAPSDADAVHELQVLVGLDPGESEAIALAAELGARLILDEYRGRRIAGQHGIPVIGSIGIVVAASRSGLITVDDAEPVLRQMARARFRVSERLIRYAIAQAREGG